MKIKEPTRKHKIPSSGKSWYTGWYYVVGGALLMFMILMMAFQDYKAKKDINQHKTTVVSEKRVVSNSRKQEFRRVEKPKELQIGEEGILVGDTQFPVGKYETVSWKGRVTGEDSWGEVYVVPSGTRVLVIGKSNRDPTVTKVRILSEGPHQGREYWFKNKYILR